LLEKLKGREIGQRLVGADGVIGALPGAQLAVQLSQLQRVGRDLIKLFRVGTVRAFDRAIEFGGAWRQHEQVQREFSAGSIAKAFLDTMGVVPPDQKFKIEDATLGNSTFLERSRRWSFQQSLWR